VLEPASVYLAIRALEQVGVLSWVNRIKRVREYVPGLFGKTSAWCWRVKRSSNAYVFNDPLTKSDFQTRTTAQDSNQEKLLQIVGHPAVSQMEEGEAQRDSDGHEFRLPGQLKNLPEKPGDQEKPGTAG
jgi:hypothetical protein